MSSDALRRMLAKTPSASDFRHGDVFMVPDHVIAFPGRSKRTRHEHRFVIVAQVASLNRNIRLPTVQVVPCTSSTRSAPAFELQLSAGSANLEKDTVGLVSLTQPIAKTDLGVRVGGLSSQQRGDLQRRMAMVFGLRSTEPNQRVTGKSPPKPPEV